MIKPKTKSEELVAALNELRKAGSFNEFEIRKLERDADALKSANAAGAYMVLGMLSCLRRDFPAMESYHENAIKLNNGSESNRNYAASLFFAGFPVKARQYYLKALNIGFESLPWCIELALYGCRPLEARELLLQYQKLFPGQPHSVESLVAKLAETSTEFSIPDDALAEAVDIAAGLLRERGQFFYGTHINDSRIPIRYEIPVQLPASEIAELNFELAERLVVNMENTYSDAILFTYCIK